ncbi:PorV/PorQ family protein, partial [bacterium]|nr:PorV/PorQ family protein [bacterium]
MSKQLILVTLIGVVLLSPPLWGQSKVGTTAAPFLTIGVGSRPIAMGGAFVSIADDANAMFWNPAGLARLPKSEVILVHTKWLADMSFNFVGAAFNMGSAGTIGASATMLNVGSMEVTTETDQEGTGIFFDSYDLAATISYGY